jgi:hypothetical protein
MIEAKLLQSFMSDIEWLRELSKASAKASMSPSEAKSAPYDPFAEILAKAAKILEENQVQENAPLGAISPQLLLAGDVFNTWLNSGHNRSASLTAEDIDKLFPDLANLNSLLGSELSMES